MKMTTSRQPTQHKVRADEAHSSLAREESALGRSLYRCSRHTNLVYSGTLARCPICDVERTLQKREEERLHAVRENERLKSQLHALKAVNEHSAAMANAAKEMSGKEHAILKDIAYAHAKGRLAAIKPHLERVQRTVPEGTYVQDRITAVEYRTGGEPEYFWPETIGGKAFLLPFFESLKVAGMKRTMHHLMIALRHSGADVVDVDVLNSEDELAPSWPKRT